MTIASPVPVISPVRPALAIASIAETASVSCISTAPAAGPTYFMASMSLDILKADWLQALLNTAVIFDASLTEIPKLVMVEPRMSAALPISTP